MTDPKELLLQVLRDKDAGDRGGMPLRGGVPPPQGLDLSRHR
jgi:hypothetical protein